MQSSLKGSRDVFATPVLQLINFLSTKRGKDASKISLKDAQEAFSTFTAEELQTYMMDTHSWVEYGSVAAGDLLFVPAGVIVASKVRSGEHAMGLKWGVRWEVDRKNTHGKLRKLKALSQQWYGKHMPTLLNDVIDLQCESYEVTKA